MNLYYNNEKQALRDIEWTLKNAKKNLQQEKSIAVGVRFTAVELDMLLYILKEYQK